MFKRKYSKYGMSKWHITSRYFIFNFYVQGQELQRVACDCSSLLVPLLRCARQSPQKFFSTQLIQLLTRPLILCDL